MTDDLIRRLREIAEELWKKERSLCYFFTPEDVARALERLTDHAPCVDASGRMYCGCGVWAEWRPPAQSHVGHATQAFLAALAAPNQEG